MGTPEYMAPEQARDTADGRHPGRHLRLGCTLYCLLTGRPPFHGGTALEIVTQQVMDAPPPVTELRPDVPAELADLVARMLAKDPGRAAADAEGSRHGFGGGCQSRQARTVSRRTSAASLPILERPANRRSRRLIPAAVAEALRPFVSPSAVVAAPPAAIPTPFAEMNVRSAVPRAARPPRRPILPAVFATGITLAAILWLTQGEPSTGRPSSKPPHLDNGFVSLFDGVSFNGWRKPDSLSTDWLAKGGIIRGESFTTLESEHRPLVTERRFANFWLQLEAMPSEGPSDGGILFRDLAVVIAASNQTHRGTGVQPALYSVLSRK